MPCGYRVPDVYRVSVSTTGPVLAEPVAAYLATLPALRAVSPGTAHAHAYVRAFGEGDATCRVLAALREAFPAFTERDVDARKVNAPAAHPAEAFR